MLGNRRGLHDENNKKVKYLMLLTIIEKRANSTFRDSFNFRREGGVPWWGVTGK